MGFLVVGLCALACLVNPWIYRVYPVAADNFIRLFQPADHIQLAESLSFFGVRNQLRTVAPSRSGRC